MALLVVAAHLGQTRPYEAVLLGGTAMEGDGGDCGGKIISSMPSTRPISGRQRQSFTTART